MTARVTFEINTERIRLLACRRAHSLSGWQSLTYLHAQGAQSGDCPCKSVTTTTTSIIADDSDEDEEDDGALRSPLRAAL